MIYKLSEGDTAEDWVVLASRFICRGVAASRAVLHYPLPQKKGRVLLDYCNANPPVRETV